jgi:hypothetical protein
MEEPKGFSILFYHSKVNGTDETHTFKDDSHLNPISDKDLTESIIRAYDSLPKNIAHLSD